MMETTSIFLLSDWHFHLRLISTFFHLRYPELVHMREDVLRDCGDVVLVDGAEKR